MNANCPSSSLFTGGLPLLLNPHVSPFTLLLGLQTKNCQKVINFSRSALRLTQAPGKRAFSGHGLIFPNPGIARSTHLTSHLTCQMPQVLVTHHASLGSTVHPPAVEIQVLLAKHLGEKL